MATHPDFAEVLAEPVGSRGVVVFFEDGTRLDHGGYRSVQSAIHGPIGLQAAFDGSPSRMLAAEVERRGLPVMAAIGTTNGGAVITDGASTWFASLWIEPLIDLSDLFDLRERSKLVRGTGAVAQHVARQPAPGAPDWVDTVLSLDAMTSRVAKQRISTEEVRRMLRVLDRNGMGGLSFDSFASLAGLPRHRVQRYLAQLVQVVNIDGYVALSIVGETVKFNRELLEYQLGANQRREAGASSA